MALVNSMRRQWSLQVLITALTLIALYFVLHRRLQLADLPWATSVTHSRWSLEVLLKVPTLISIHYLLHRSENILQMAHLPSAVCQRGASGWTGHPEGDGRVRRARGGSAYSWRPQHQVACLAAVVEPDSWVHSIFETACHVRPPFPYSCEMKPVCKATQFSL